MPQSDKPKYQNRAITVDFHDESCGSRKVEAAETLDIGDGNEHPSVGGVLGSSQ